jgi:iron complex outermembrane receptor protein
VLLDTSKGGQTFNAGAATIYGAEAAADFQLTDNDTIRASVNYLHARYDELLAQFNVYTVPGTGPDINGVGDLDPNTPGIQQPNFEGNTPAFSPEWIATLEYDHVFDLGDVGNLTARANTTYKDSYFTDFFNYSDGQQDAYFQTDVSLEYKPVNGHWSVLAFAKNLEDERPLTYGSFVSPARTTSTTGNSARRARTACGSDSSSDERGTAHLRAVPLRRVADTRA